VTTLVSLLSSGNFLKPTSTKIGTTITCLHLSREIERGCYVLTNYVDLCAPRLLKMTVQE